MGLESGGGGGQQGKMRTLLCADLFTNRWGGVEGFGVGGRGNCRSGPLLFSVNVNV